VSNDGRGTGRKLLVLLGAVSAAGGTHAAAAQDTPGAPASPIEYEGWRQYMVHCARCHGDDAVGGIMAPDLRASVARGVIDSVSFPAVVSAGRRGKGMPSFKDVLTDEQIARIFAYLVARVTGHLSSGRPRTAP
jgi:mono/diheme cytochrome c family protein